MGATFILTVQAPNGRQKSSLKKLALPPVSSELGDVMCKG